MATTQNVTIKVVAVDNTGGAFAQVQRKVDELKKQFGPRSFGKDIAEIAVGGGAVAGISFIGNVFADASKKVADMAEEMKKGKASAADLISEFARSAPVLGGFVRGFDSIINVITGAQGELDKLNESIAETNKRTEEMIKRAEGFRVASAGVAGLRDFNDARPGRIGAAPVPQLGQVLRGVFSQLSGSGRETGGALTGTLGYNPFGSLDNLRRIEREREEARRNLLAIGKRPEVYTTDQDRGVWVLHRARDSRLRAEKYDTDRARLSSDLDIKTSSATRAREIIDGLFSEQIRAIRDGAKDAADAIAGPTGFVGVLRATLPSLALLKDTFSKPSINDIPQELLGSGFGGAGLGTGEAIDPAAVLDAAQGDASLRSSASGRFAGVLRGRLSQLQRLRSSAYAGRFASSFSSRGASGVESIGASSLNGPSAEETRLTKVLEKLEKDQAKRDDLTGDLAKAISDLARELGVKPPNASEDALFN